MTRRHRCVRAQGPRSCAPGRSRPAPPTRAPGAWTPRLPPPCGRALAARTWGIGGPFSRPQHPPPSTNAVVSCGLTTAVCTDETPPPQGYGPEKTILFQPQHRNLLPPRLKPSWLAALASESAPPGPVATPGRRQNTVRTMQAKHRASLTPACALQTLEQVPGHFMQESCHKLARFRTRFCSWKLGNPNLSG